MHSAIDFFVARLKIEVDKNGKVSVVKKDTQDSEGTSAESDGS